MRFYEKVRGVMRGYKGNKKDKNFILHLFFEIFCVFL